jgi:Uma2 family endonuclease
MVSIINTSPLVKTYTLEEFWQLPEPPDRSKLELIAGVLYMTPPPDYTHDNIVTRLARVFILHLEATNNQSSLYVPRAAIWTSRNTHLEPDLFYLSAETEARLDPKHRNTADLVVEVISPGSAIYDRNTKAETYGALEVGELWLVDETGETIEVRYQTGQGFDEGQAFKQGEQVSSRIFPSLQLRVEQLFAD